MTIAIRDCVIATTEGHLTNKLYISFFLDEEKSVDLKWLICLMPPCAFVICKSFEAIAFVAFAKIRKDSFYFFVTGDICNSGTF